MFLLTVFFSWASNMRLFFTPIFGSAVEKKQGCKIPPIVQPYKINWNEQTKPNQTKHNKSNKFYIFNTINGQTFTVWSACVVRMILTFIMCVARLNLKNIKKYKKNRTKKKHKEMK